VNADRGALPPVALLSFPKCGRTWFKAMLKAYFERAFGVDSLPFDGHVEWHRRDPRIPRLLVEHDDDPHFKAVEELRAGKQRFAKHAVILLVRDPRDVIVSLFYEMTRRTRFYEDWGFDTARVTQDAEDLSTFIRGPVGRLDVLLAYWNIWAQQRGEVRAFTVARYEDLHSSPVEELTRLLAFIGVEPSPEHVERAIEECRFEQMKKREAKGSFDSKTLQPADPEDPDSFKVRKGKVGGYLEELSAVDLDWIDERVAGLPDFLSCYRSRS
jgi:hypothetical protein